MRAGLSTSVFIVPGPGERAQTPVSHCRPPSTPAMHSRASTANVVGLHFIRPCRYGSRGEGLDEAMELVLLQVAIYSILPYAMLLTDSLVEVFVHVVDDSATLV